MPPKLSSSRAKAEPPAVAEGRRAAELRRAGRREEAVAVLQRALGAAPEAAWLHAELGETLRELGGRRQGYIEIQKAVRLDPACAYAPERLEGDPRREQAWVYGCRAGGLRMQGRLDEAERDLLSAVDLDPGCGWAWGWLGEIRLRQGRAAEALSAFDRAVALFAEWPEIFALRGETERLLGLDAEARSDLDQAAALGCSHFEVYLSRARVRKTLGDRDGSLKDLAEAARCAPEAFKSRVGELGDPEGARWALEALKGIEKAAGLLEKASAAAKTGKAPEALDLAERALALDPGGAKTHAFRAELYAAQGRYEDALKDVESALRLAPSADLYARKADFGQKLGYMEQAIKDLSIAVGLAPSAATLRWRAQTFLGMRHYDLALQDISSALELDPADPSLYDLRAQVHLVLGKLGPCLEDVEKALALAPASMNLQLRRGQVLALQHRFDEAEAGLAALKKTQPAWAAFILGYVRCVAKRYDLAGAEFDKAAKGAGESEPQLKLQAGFYAAVTKAMGAYRGETEMEERKKKRLEKGKVYLCGLGVYPPQTATVEVLKAISECDVIFNNLPGMGISEFLGLFCSNRRPVAFRYEQDAKLCADLVLSEVKAGRTAGFVTFGHPLLFGPLSNEIIKECKRLDIPCKAFGAVSSMDAVLAASGQVLGFSYSGYQIYETTNAAVLDDIACANSRLPIIIYLMDGMSDEWFAKLALLLEKSHSAEHRCLLFGPKHELWETTQDSMTVKELAKISHHKIAQGILFVPPRDSKVPARR